MACLNFDIYLKVDLIKIYLTSSLKFKIKDEREYGESIINGNFDVCKSTKSLIGNFMMRIFMDKLSESSNLKLNCPIKAQNYYAKNLPLPVDKYIPTYFLPFKGLWKTEFTVKAKSAVSKKFAVMFSLRIFGNTL